MIWSLEARSVELFHLLGLMDDMNARGRQYPPITMYKYPEGREVDKVVQMVEMLEPTPDMPWVRRVACNLEQTRAC